MSSNAPVVIVGAGLSGLSCARRLLRAGVEVVVLEAEDGVGGRVRTDVVDGFRLDRGFQVLQTAYPEARQQLDYPSLDLRPFAAGALIRTRGRLVRMSDPWRRPQDLLATLFNGVGTLGDRWRMAGLRRKVTRGDLDALWQAPDSTTADFLRGACGFSSDMVQRFFRPWFAGVFLEDQLETSSRFFRFVFRMLSLGDASLPADGMGAIAEQLAAELPESAVRLGTPVESIATGTVRLRGGQEQAASAVVLAVDAVRAAKLAAADVEPPPSRSTACFYYAADQPPPTGKFLALNGDGEGPINNYCVPSNVAPSYAPEGMSLISASVVGPRASDSPQLETEVRKQLRQWHGAAVDDWRLLRSYYIRHALPGQVAGRVPATPRRLADGLYQCGDYCQTASIQGAMLSGRHAAEAVLGDAG